MVAVAVGRLHDDVVGLGEDGRVADDRPVPLSQVAGKDDSSRPSVVGHLQLDLVIAGTDPVAIDAFGATCLDMQPDDIFTVKQAYKLGIGEMDLSKLSISEIEL